MATDAAKVPPSPGCTRSSHALTDCAIPGTPQAFFLKANEDGVSLHTHLSEVLQSLLKSKDPNALANFESISLDVKAGRFQPSIGVKVRHHRWELLAGPRSRHTEAPPAAAARINLVPRPVAAPGTAGGGRHVEEVLERALHRRL